MKLEIIYRQFHNNMRAQFRPNAASGTRQSQMEQHQTRQSQPYWLNQDYLQSILSQNQELKNDFVPAPPPSTTTIILTNPVSQPVSTSCGPRGCTASLGSSSVSSGLPLAPVTRPTSRPTPGHPDHHQGQLGQALDRQWRLTNRIGNYYLLRVPTSSSQHFKGRILLLISYLTEQ